MATTAAAVILQRVRAGTVSPFDAPAIAREAARLYGTAAQGVLEHIAKGTDGIGGSVTDPDATIPVATLEELRRMLRSGRSCAGDDKVSATRRCCWRL